MVFTIEFCDKIREIYQLVEAFEKKEKKDYINLYLTSIKYSDYIEEFIIQYIRTLCEELVEAKLIIMKPFKFLLKIRKVFLYIEYGVNNNDGEIEYDFYLSLLEKKPAMD